MIYLIALLFNMTFIDGYFLYKNGTKYYDEELIFAGKLIMRFCCIGLPISFLLYMTGV